MRRPLVRGDPGGSPPGNAAATAAVDAAPLCNTYEAVAQLLLGKIATPPGTPRGAPSSPTARDARCGRGRSAPAVCTTRRLCGPRAPPTCSSSFPRSRPRSTPGTGAWPKEFPGQAQAPPLKPKKDAAPGEVAAWDAERHQQSSERICVEHANAEHKQWRTLQRFPGRREDFDETCRAVAGLVSRRAAER